MAKVNKPPVIAAIILLILILSGVIHAAESLSEIKFGEDFPRDWLTAKQDVRNAGTIKGDMISLGQSISSEGVIHGDLIGAAGDISIRGTVDGDLRAAAAGIAVNGKIGKNINAFANHLSIGPSGEVGGNLLAFSASTEISGKVRGYTRLVASKIVLMGEFFGDVDINTEIHYADEDGVSITVMPGTTIHGTLTYKSLKEADIRNGASIKEIRWEKPVVAEKEKRQKNKSFSIWKLIKTLISMAIYYLVGLIFYKLFPALFRRQSEVIDNNPLKVIGVGLIALIGTLAVFIIFIMSLVITALVASPNIAFVFGTAAAFIYVILFYFSSIPVSLWLGNKILGGNPGIPASLAAGLTVITLAIYTLKVLSSLQLIGVTFSILLFVVSFVVAVIGIGAILCIGKEVLSGIKCYEMTFQRDRE